MQKYYPQTISFLLKYKTHDTQWPRHQAAEKVFDTQTQSSSARYQGKSSSLSVCTLVHLTFLIWFFFQSSQKQMSLEYWCSK